MKERFHVSPKHPRAESIRIREKLIKHFEEGVVAKAGLIAHGRGEAFDYLLGEKTTPPALEAIKASAAFILEAGYPVISVNGNVAALVADDIVKLAESSGAKIEVNLFYRSKDREEAIARILREAGAKEILGVGDRPLVKIDEIHSERRRVDPDGILKSDVVLLGLEDGDRTEALRRMGKTVIVVDLNPLSRSSQWASITIVDNIVRAIPALTREAERQKAYSGDLRTKIIQEYDNRRVLSEAIKLILERLSNLSERGIFIDEASEL